MAAQLEDMISSFKHMAKSKYAKSDCNDMEVFYAEENFADWCVEIKQLRELKKRTEEREKELVAKITKKMGDKTILCTEDGQILAEYKPQKPRTNIDFKCMEELEPERLADIRKDYGYQIIVRSFTVKK